MPKNPVHQQQSVRQKPLAEAPNPYARLYRLRENPFPSHALFRAGTSDPRLNGKIYDKQFRRLEEQKFFELFVQPPAGEPPLQIGFLRLDPHAGGRGNGKSAFLNRLMQRVNDQDWADLPHNPDGPELLALAIHVLAEPRRQKNFFELIHLIFKSLALRKSRAEDAPVFAKVDANLRAAMLLRLLQPEQIDALAAKPSDEMSSILAARDTFTTLLREHGLTWSDFITEAGEATAEAGGDTLDAEFVGMLDQVEWTLGELWPLLENQNGRAWQYRGVDWLINGLMPALMAAGYRHFYLLLDEFEKIYIHQTSKKRDEFLDSFRQYFYERDSAAGRQMFISSLLTLHPSIDKYLVDNWARTGLEQLAPITPPRMKMYSIPLGASDARKLGHLLITYIDHYRDGAKTEHGGTLYPFADGALDPAMLAARFYPRDTLWYAHAILRKAAQESVAPPIRRDYVESFIAQGERPPEDDEDQIFKLPLSEVDLRR